MIENPEKILEAALFSAAEPLTADKLSQLFDEAERPSLGQIREWIANLKTVYETRGVELVEVASGYRFQARADFAPYILRLEERKPQKYSRTFLETLSLIAYRQPITRGEIEDVRGVAVNPNVIRTLMEREWIKIVGYRDVPGKPALFSTTKIFLDYFNLKNLSDLPPLSELVDFEALEKQLGMKFPQAELESGMRALEPAHEDEIASLAAVESDEIESEDTMEEDEIEMEMDELEREVEVIK